jgi:hypothetical protein
MAETADRSAEEELARWLRGDAPATRNAVRAAGRSGNRELTSHLVALLEDRKLGAHAAHALGHLGATETAGAIAERLRHTRDGVDHERFLVALELLDEPSVVPALLRRLTDRDPAKVGSVHRALVRLTGRDPLIPWLAKRRVRMAAIRQAWSTVDIHVPPRPELREIAVPDAARASFLLDDGLGRIRIDYDVTSPGSNWPRWHQSLRVAGQRVYHVGSGCGTCETTIALLGWPVETVATASTRLRDRLADLPALDHDLLDAMRPLLVGLPTGHYRVFLLDLDLEWVTEPDASWWARRVTARDDPDDDPDEDDEPFWPGTAHFQLRAPIPGPERTYGVVLPSRAPEQISPRRVDELNADIASGARPAALLWGWTEQRYVEMQYPERFLVAMVLDGHHKLTAYARAGVPARAVLIVQLENCWESRDAPTATLTEITTPLLAQ